MSACLTVEPPGSTMYVAYSQCCPSRWSTQMLVKPWSPNAHTRVVRSNATLTSASVADAAQREVTCSGVRRSAITVAAGGDSSSGDARLPSCPADNSHTRLRASQQRTGG